VSPLTTIVSLNPTSVFPLVPVRWSLSLSADDSVRNLCDAADPNRCERGFDGNTIGQANGVSDKQLDIR
jgi:hypothetical protein